MERFWRRVLVWLLSLQVRHQCLRHAAHSEPFTLSQPSHQPATIITTPVITTYHGTVVLWTFRSLRFLAGHEAKSALRTAQGSPLMDFGSNGKYRTDHEYTGRITLRRLADLVTARLHVVLPNAERTQIHCEHPAQGSEGWRLLDICFWSQPGPAHDQGSRFLCRWRN